ncbi:hypothetical protein RNJ44_02442 [Nakaseomyces bracarensis]|uniref:Uncharacterized protein n=1 Tax=Nakaseomyces bracarensis TaxID=273131 RepID=A0ABR4NLP7_9SACH
MYTQLSPVITNGDMTLMMLQQEQAKMQRRRAKRNYHETYNEHHENECKKLKLNYSYNIAQTNSTPQLNVPSVELRQAYANNIIFPSITNSNRTNDSHSSTTGNDSDSEPYAEVEDYMVKGYCLDEKMPCIQDAGLGNQSYESYNSTESMEID